MVVQTRIRIGDRCLIPSGRVAPNTPSPCMGTVCRVETSTIFVVLEPSGITYSFASRDVASWIRDARDGDDDPIEDSDLEDTQVVEGTWDERVMRRNAWMVEEHHRLIRERDDARRAAARHEHESKILRGRLARQTALLVESREGSKVLRDGIDNLTHQADFHYANLTQLEEELVVTRAERDLFKTQALAFHARDG